MRRSYYTQSTFVVRARLSLNRPRSGVLALQRGYASSSFQSSTCPWPVEFARDRPSRYRAPETVHVEVREGTGPRATEHRKRFTLKFARDRPSRYGTRASIFATVHIVRLSNEYARLPPGPPPIAHVPRNNDCRFGGIVSIISWLRLSRCHCAQIEL